MSSPYFSTKIGGVVKMAVGVKYWEFCFRGTRTVMLTENEYIHSFTLWRTAVENLVEIVEKLHFSTGKPPLYKNASLKRDAYFFE